jgi:hypothetical protein
VSEHTLKAIEKTESVPIAERKQRLLTKAARIAEKAADRIEDQIDGANITQASVAFGVVTEKMLLLSGDPTIRIEHSIEPGLNLYKRLAELQAQIQPIQPEPIEAHMIEPVTDQPALPNAEAISDLAAGNGLEPGRKTSKKLE